MARLIDTANIPGGLSNDQKLWVYNGLDCCVTLEVHEVLTDKLTEQTRAVYDFERAMQGPALTMMRRGVLTDPGEVAQGLNKLYELQSRVTKVLQALAHAIWEKPLNPASPPQLRALLYDHMGFEPPLILIKGERKISTGREALEKLRDRYIWAGPIVNCILMSRDLAKKIQVLKSGIDPDHRLRCSFNVGATETGRWSSSKNVRGRGMNMQNVTNDLRRMFVSDKGRKFGYVDLEQAESRAVAYLAGDEAYIKACESSDLHTYSAGLIWPDIITLSNSSDARAAAERMFYRHFTYRDMSKRGGHAYNYYAKPYTVSRNLKIPYDVAELFQGRYFMAFPGIPDWHSRTAREMWSHGFLETPAIPGVHLGRRRIFFGRPNDDATLREGIAYRPQSIVADVLNIGLYRLWRLERETGVRVLAQVHDAILYDYPEGDEGWVVPLVEKICRLEVPIHQRVLVIPTETKVGYTWYEDRSFKRETRPRALGSMEKWHPDGRTKAQIRPEPTSPFTILDRRISPTHGALEVA